MTERKEPRVHEEDLSPLRERPGYYHQSFYDGWNVEMWWSPDSTGGPTEMRIKPSFPDQVTRGITTGTLRSIPLVEISRELKGDLQRLSLERQGLDQLGPYTNWAMWHIRETVRANPKPGRTGRPQSFYLAVAVIYAWYVLMREPNPVQDLAEIIGADRRAAANWVSLARKNQMLTEAAERQSGGALTDTALALLNEMKEDGRTN